MGAKKSSKRPGKKADGQTNRTPTRVKKEIQSLDRKIQEAIDQRADLVAEYVDLSADTDSPLQAGQAFANDAKRSTNAQAELFKQIDSFCLSQSQTVRISYLGPIYSYSYLAADQAFGQFHELIPLNSIAAVFSQISTGESDYGVVPIENSTDGRIADTLTRFSQHQVTICREIHLPIHHCLIGLGKIKDIREIRSKAQALSQCRNWLDQTFSSKVQRVATTSSSEAARDAQKMGKGVAAIASSQAAIGLELNVISPNIEDQKGNMTRFAVIVNPENPKIELPGKTGNDKTSIMFGIPHKPGSLADVINIFKRAKLNLTWIESFPKPGAFSEYTFFAEFQGHQKEVKVRNALASLDKKTEELTLLGSYPEYSIR